jgi:opacity protein-like surface antigen
MLFLGFTLFVAARLDAQVPGLSIGPQIGYQKANSADDGKFIGGAAVRLRLNELLGVEGSLAYRQEDYASGGVTVKSLPLMVTGLIYPFPAVYGAVGAGWYNTTFDYNPTTYATASDETLQKFGWHFGGGIEAPPESNVRFTADIRYVFLNYDFQKLPGTDGINADFWVATVGLMFGL